MSLIQRSTPTPLHTHMVNKNENKHIMCQQSTPPLPHTQTLIIN